MQLQHQVWRSSGRGSPACNINSYCNFHAINFSSPQIAVLHARYHLFSFFQIFYYFLLQHFVCGKCCAHSATHTEFISFGERHQKVVTIKLNDSQKRQLIFLDKPCTNNYVLIWGYHGNSLLPFPRIRQIFPQLFKGGFAKWDFCATDIQLNNFLHVMKKHGQIQLMCKPLQSP